MRTATLVIDTFPQGGGWSLCEAMSMEIPVIGCRDDVLSMYREEQWRPILTALNIPGSAFDPTDVDGMLDRALFLLDNPEERRIAGRIARESIEESLDLRPTSEAIEAEFERLFAES
jgi:glycosyltransferase involved in cell wall biosynthesis